MRRWKTRALTLVEVLVSIFIVGLLAALLLPAVQASRESARRNTCLSNLRQLGIALSAYHDQSGCYPAMVIWSPAGEPLGGGRVPIGVIDRVASGLSLPDTIYSNWLIALLPFIEESSLFSAFDSHRPISDVSNAAVRSTPISLLRCPSDPYSVDDNAFERGESGNGYARGNFAINVGPNARCIRPGTPQEPCDDGFWVTGTNLLHDNTQVWGSGIAGVNKGLPRASITDGTSRTIAVSEIRAGIDPVDPRGAWALGQVGSSATAGNGRDGQGDCAMMGYLA